MILAYFSGVAHESESWINPVDNIPMFEVNNLSKKVFPVFIVYVYMYESYCEHLKKENKEQQNFVSQHPTFNHFDDIETRYHSCHQ